MWACFMLSRVATPSSPVRERERGRERKRERERELFLILKGMMGALAPFSYLVYLYVSGTERERERVTD